MEDNPATWMAIAALVITAFREVMTQRHNRQVERDKMEFDKKVTLLEVQLATTRTELDTTRLLQLRSTADSEAAKKAVEECKEGHEKIEADFRAYRAQHETNSSRLDKLEAANGSEKPTKG